MIYTAQLLGAARRIARLGPAMLATTGLVFSCGVAAAQSHAVDPHAYMATTASEPVLEGPVAGAWRYQLLRRGCPHKYPMLENAQCATASGGPAGGIN